MALNTEELLESSRRELLDLSTRNRLLSIPVDSGSARIVPVREAGSAEVYRLLVQEKKPFSFLSAQAAKPKATGRVQGEVRFSYRVRPTSDPEDSETLDEEPETSRRPADCLLQTSLSPDGLQRRLLDLFHDSRTMMEETGVNILYLALGHLRWFEASEADTPRYAPLILVPVELSRKSASEKFVLRCTEAEIVENLSLYAKLQEDFGIELPPFEGGDEFDIAGYLDELADAIAGARNWEIQRDEITLGFFSFAKFLMFRDLDPKTWPNPAQLLSQPLIAGLLQDGFPPQTENTFHDGSQLDELIPVAKLDHVVDADATQTLAIESVRQGRNLVIQGPPGTGKSQSITNIIAAAVLDGKKVLFVAEKLAALQVVQRRLEREGLGPICLELHSNKSSKKVVIEELGRTWGLGRPQARDLESLISKLQDKRDILNRHVWCLHEPYKASGLTAFAVIGQLSWLEKRGQAANELTFVGAEDWTSDQRQANQGHIEGLAKRIDQIGLPISHPWRGTNLTAVLQIDLDPLSKRIRQTVASVGALVETTAALAGRMSQRASATFADAEECLIIAGLVVSAPGKIDKIALGNELWNGDLGTLSELVAAGHRFAEAQKQLQGKVVEAAWEQDFTSQRQQIGAHGNSLFRIFNGKYRAAVADLRGVAKASLPGNQVDRLALIDAIITAQQALRRLRDGAATGQAAFGTHWKLEKSDWAQLEGIINWVAKQTQTGLDGSFRGMFAGITDIAGMVPLVEQLTGRLAAAKESAKRIGDEVKADCATAFGAADFKDINLQHLMGRLTIWSDSIAQLPAWASYVARSQQARSEGLGSLVDFLETGKIPTRDAADAYDRIYYSQLLRGIVQQKPELAHFDGDLHERHVADFRELDSERLALAKYRVLQAHFEQMPQPTAVGAAGIVRSEMERQRGHRPVRRLLRDAGPVVQAIKPVFLMSPLSVAQFLEPGAVEFDMLVIDEASQVQPVDALGAAARCKQIVVVGDSKQLPPTKFFARMTSDLEEGDEESDEPMAAPAEDIESILGLCSARGLPDKMLRWHYRSRHHSLIAVSNHEFYEDRLFVVPSPYMANPELGLKYHLVKEGVFDAGASATNRVEAKLVCQAILEHAQVSPQLTLGVAAFSVKQQKAIRDELELLRRQEPTIEAFIANHPTEPFFCKNLENVQGDERDVIFISVGYGKNASGYMAMRFGPLGSEGGERRLNVLISRAKRRCHVFASITADDIDLERARGQGVAALKVFLNYAEKGLLGTALASGREEDSPFERSVRRAVESLGYEVVPQVGQAGFFIDLGVRDRRQPGRYLLGIECDGATYHSSKSARDRDRLRQAVLEDHGWIIHRVWSTDWFQKPVEQLRKISAAIEAAKSGTHRNDAPRTRSVEAVPRESAPSSISDDSLAKLAVPYQEVNFPVPNQQEPDSLSTGSVEEIIKEIIRLEGPIHVDELTNRVKTLWGYSRAGSRIQGAVNNAVYALAASNLCQRADGFLFQLGAPVRIRNRENVASANLRRPDMICPLEICEAILAVIDLGCGARAKEIPVAVARLFGLKNTSAQMRSAVESQLQQLVTSNQIVEVNGLCKRAG